MAGRLFFVIGPSGSGKDALIAYARSRLGPGDGVRFARRYITRPPDDREEHHIPLSDTEFRDRLGEFLMSWSAYGVHYGVDRQVLADLAAGFDVVLNGSRAYLDNARRLVPELVPILVEASDEALRDRLARRGRNGADIDARLDRAHRFPCSEIQQAIRIRNDGDPAEAGRLLCHVLTAPREGAVVSEAV